MTLLDAAAIVYRTTPKPMGDRRQCFTCPDLESHKYPIVRTVNIAGEQYCICSQCANSQLIDATLKHEATL